MLTYKHVIPQALPNLFAVSLLKKFLPSLVFTTREFCNPHTHVYFEP